MIRNDSPPRTLEEVWLHDRLRVLREEYERAAKPYIDRLAAIESMRAPQPFIIEPSQIDPASGIRLGGIAL